MCNRFASPVLFAAAVCGIMLLTASSASAQFDSSGLYKVTTSAQSFSTGGFTDTSVDNCDECSQEIPIGFSFAYYGSTFSTFEITSNGWGTFDTSISGNPYNGGGTLPGTGYPSNTIAVAGTDLDPDCSVGCSANNIDRKTIGTAPNRVFIVYYEDVDYIGSFDDVDCQIKLYETTNVVELHYGNNDDNTLISQDKSAGIQNGARNHGYQAWRQTGTAGPPDNIAYRFDPNPVVNSFTQSTSGTIVSGQLVSYSLVFDRSVSNVQTSDFVITGSGSSGASVTGISGSGAAYVVTVNVGTVSGSAAATVGVRLDDSDRSIHAQNTGRLFSTFDGAPYTVVAPASISVTPSTVTFPNVYNGFTDTADVVIENTGGLSLVVTAMSSDNAVYSVTNGTSFSIAPGTSRVATIQFAPVSSGIYNGAAITVVSNASNDNTFTITLNGTATNAPPTAPSNPGSTAVTENSITWTWTDTSFNESSFGVYAGLDTPPLLITQLLGPDTVQWAQFGLAANRNYAMQVAAFNDGGVSSKTGTVTRWTLVEPVTSLAYPEINQTSIRVAASNSPSNLNLGSSGLFVFNNSAGTNSGWMQDNTGWLSTGLQPNFNYSFQAKTRNGESVETALATGTKYTLAASPSLGNNVAATASLNTYLAAGAITFSNPAGFGPATGSGQLFQVSSYDYVWDTSPDTPSFAGASTWQSGTIALNPSATGAYYLHLRSRNGENVPGASADIGPFLIDADPPAGSLIIGGTTPPGPAYTTLPTVSLNLVGTDSGSGVEKMRFSNDGVTWSPSDWAAAPAFSPSVPSWLLSAGDGPKTVFAQFRDAVGLVSTLAITDEIILDTTRPTQPQVFGSTPTSNTSPTWSWVSGGSADSAEVYRYQLNGTLGTWTETTALNYTYSGPPLVDGAQVLLFVEERDNAGNWSFSTLSIVEIDLTSPAAPQVSGVSPTNTPFPSWTWSSGGGSGVYRIGFTDGAWFDIGTTDTSYNRPTPVAEGSYTLYVQERDSAANWSPSGVFAITVDLTPPVITIDGPNPATSTGDDVYYSVTVQDADNFAIGLDEISLLTTGDAEASFRILGNKADFQSTVELYDISGVGEITLKVAAGVGNDAAGNASPEAYAAPLVVDAPKSVPLAVWPLMALLPAAGALALFRRRQ
jgi:hypothetical protein